MDSTGTDTSRQVSVDSASAAFSALGADASRASLATTPCLPATGMGASSSRYLYAACAVPMGPPRSSLTVSGA